MSPAHKEALRQYDGTAEPCAQKDTCNRYDKRMGKRQHKHILSMSSTIYNISSRMKKKKNSILSWKGQRLSTRSWWTNEGDQAGYVTIWGQTSFLSRGKWVLISWRLYIHSWNVFICPSQQAKKKKKISSGLWVTLSLIKKKKGGNNSYTVVTHSLHHGGMENSIVLNILWDKMWVCGVVGGSLTLNEKKQQDGDR